MSIDLFISYARDDAAVWAKQFCDAVAIRGVNAWHDVRDVDPFADFSGEIEKAIESSKAIVVGVTPALSKRKDTFVRREILYAQAWGKPIIPILVDGCPRKYVPTLINHLSWIDASDVSAAAERVLAILQDRDLPDCAPATHADPFRAYLQTLYKEVVDFLDRTVFTLIDLHTTAVDDAIVEHHARKALPIGFVAVDWRKALPEKESPATFQNFMEAFAHYHGRVLLLGEPGSGKTTTLMSFAREAIAQRLEDPSMPLPVVVPVSTWNSTGRTSLLTWLGNELEMLSVEELEQLQGNGELLLLFDGLDELGAEIIIRDPDTNKITDQFDPRERFVTELSSLQNSHIVLSSRRREYNEVSRRVDLSGSVYINSLNDEQLEEFLADKGTLLEQISRDKGLRELARTPLILSLLTYSYCHGLRSHAGEEAIPENPSDFRDMVFRQYVQNRFHHESMRAFSPLPLSLDEIYCVFGHAAALDLLTVGDNDIKVDYVADYFALGREQRGPHVWRLQIDGEVMQKVKNQLEMALECGKLLHLIAHRGNGFRFGHLHLRDHLALKYCLEGLKGNSRFSKAASTQALGRIAGTAAFSALAEIYISPERPSLGGLGALEDHGRRAIAELAASRPSWNEDTLLCDALESGDKSLIYGALIVWHDSKLCPPQMDRIVCHDEIVIRSELANLLGRIPGARSVSTLCQLLKDKHPYVRVNAAYSLRRLKASSARSDLTAATKDPSSDVRAFAEWALRAIPTTSRWGATKGRRRT